MIASLEDHRVRGLALKERWTKYGDVREYDPEGLILNHKRTLPFSEIPQVLLIDWAK